MMLVGVYPGPGVANAEKTQRFMKIFIDDLIRLYEDGILVRTPKYPHGVCAAEGGTISC